MKTKICEVKNILNRINGVVSTGLLLGDFIPIYLTFLVMGFFKLMSKSKVAALHLGPKEE